MPFLIHNMTSKNTNSVYKKLKKFISPLSFSIWALEAKLINQHLYYARNWFPDFTYYIRIIYLLPNMVSILLIMIMIMILMTRNIHFHILNTLKTEVWKVLMTRAFATLPLHLDKPNNLMLVDNSALFEGTSLTRVMRNEVLPDSNGGADWMRIEGDLAPSAFSSTQNLRLNFNQLVSNLRWRTSNWHQPFDSLAQTQCLESWVGLKRSVEWKRRWSEIEIADRRLILFPDGSTFPVGNSSQR